MCMRELWGLSKEIIEECADELLAFHQEFAPLFRTQTRDVSEHGLTGLKGSLLMEGTRSYVEGARKIVDPLDDGQNYQHFMSDSPWDSRAVFDAIHAQIRQTPGFGGGMLHLDDSGDWCSSTDKAGAQRQYLGRLGKVDVGQVGGVASYYHQGLWALVEAELFLPESWFTKEKRRLWTRFHSPPEREFASKLEIAQARFDHAIEQGLPFEVVGMDTWYGRDGAFRDHIARKGKRYMASIPCDTEVYLDTPQIGVPEKPVGQRGPACRNERVLPGVVSVTVSQVAQDLEFEPIELRDGERGVLRAEYAFCEVWTLRDEERQDADGKPSTGLRAVKEVLVIRKDSPRKVSSSLSNAPLTTDRRVLAGWKADRYFVERTIQDAKTEAGWDDLSSPKYRAYMHTLAIDALAIWFIDALAIWFVARVKLKMRTQQAHPEAVTEALGVRRLPDLSFANVRELLRTVFPLKTLTKDEAVEFVTHQLVRRAKSTRSRLKRATLLI
jgi:SRSO17 transposase